MEILEKIGDAASKTYKFTAEKTSKFARETKLKMQISECKRKIEDIYLEIGKAVYEKTVVDEEIRKEDLKEKCNEIDALSGKIVECKNEILTLKERKQCQNCYEEIELTAKFCPNCGFQQPEIEKEECASKETESCEEKEEVKKTETEENSKEVEDEEKKEEK